MTNPQRLLIAAVFIVAVVGGGLLAANLIGGPGSSASPGPVAVASGSTAPASASPAPSQPPSDAPSPSEAPESELPSSPVVPSASASAPPSATPRPTTAPGQPATVVFTNLKLDAKDDPAGRNRRLTFESQGAGPITVKLGTLSPQGSTIMCLSADGKRLACKTTAAGAITAKTTTRHASFVLTLRGAGIETPVVEVTITFPAKDPAVTITDARFDGTAFPETNGITAIVSPRGNGEIALEADWGGHPFLYEIDLFEQGGSGTQTLANQGPATRVSERFTITGTNPWKLLLQNIEQGFGATLMTATVAWP